MNTRDIEIALMRHLDIRQNIIVPNVFWGMNLFYECDLVKLSPNNYATEIEIKVSKQDLLKDKEKKRNHNSNLFKYLYFAVPEKLQELALKEIPTRAGLFVIFENDKGQKYAREIRKPVKNEYCKKWSEHQRYKLTRLGAMRILGLMEVIEDLRESLKTIKEAK
jgi:hypothetical protein